MAYLEGENCRSFKGKECSILVLKGMMLCSSFFGLREDFPFSMHCFVEFWGELYMVVDI